MPSWQELMNDDRIRSGDNFGEAEVRRAVGLGYSIGDVNEYLRRTGTVATGPGFTSTNNTLGDLRDGTMGGFAFNPGSRSSGNTLGAGYQMYQWNGATPAPGPLIAAPAPAPAPAPAAAPAPSATGTSAIDQYNANFAASQGVQSQYAPLPAPITSAENPLNATIASLTSMMAQSQAAAQQAAMQQQSMFNNMMMQSERNMAAMREQQASAFRAANAIVPAPERGAVAPLLGDARTGGRNAAENTLSNLRIVSPGLLDGGQGSVTLGGF